MAQFYLGYISEFQREFEQAKERYTESLKSNNDNILAAIQLGRILRKLGEVELSEKYFQLASKLDPKSQDARYNMAKLYMEKKNTREKTLPMAHELIKEDPHNYRAHCLIGIYYLKAKDFD
jgi:cytochrome c-type biogenesis protein CcmH/NrfG